ncbi:MAG: hypothetical protein CEN90_745 [Parcubacteria group bacterium Licking1014_17]|nr:MAG: hypothetical protein CEN90_745 [Parcubacteria group bacterium Licking1014_17]
MSDIKIKTADYTAGEDAVNLAHRIKVTGISMESAPSIAPGSEVVEEPVKEAGIKEVEEKGFDITPEQQLGIEINKERFNATDAYKKEIGLSREVVDVLTKNPEIPAGNIEDLKKIEEAAELKKALTEGTTVNEVTDETKRLAEEAEVNDSPQKNSNKMFYVAGGAVGPLKKKPTKEAEAEKPEFDKDNPLGPNLEFPRELANKEGVVFTEKITDKPNQLKKEEPKRESTVQEKEPAVSVKSEKRPSELPKAQKESSEPPLEKSAEPPEIPPIEKKTEEKLEKPKQTPEINLKRQEDLEYLKRMTKGWFGKACEKTKQFAGELYTRHGKTYVTRMLALWPSLEIKCSKHWEYEAKTKKIRWEEEEKGWRDQLNEINQNIAQTGDKLEKLELMQEKRKIEIELIKTGTKKERYMGKFNVWKSNTERYATRIRNTAERTMGGLLILSSPLKTKLNEIGKKREEVNVNINLINEELAGCDALKQDIVKQLHNAKGLRRSEKYGLKRQMKKIDIKINNLLRTKKVEDKRDTNLSARFSRLKRKDNYLDGRIGEMKALMDEAMVNKEEETPYEEIKSYKFTDFQREAGVKKEESAGGVTFESTTEAGQEEIKMKGEKFLENWNKILGNPEINPNKLKALMGNSYNPEEEMPISKFTRMMKVFLKRIGEENIADVRINKFIKEMKKQKVA